MPGAYACPDAQVLEKLILGLMPPLEGEPLLCHLQECDSCMQTVRTLRSRDTLVDAVSAQAFACKDPDEDTVIGLIQRLQGMNIALVHPSSGSGRDKPTPNGESGAPATESASVGGQPGLNAVECSEALNIHADPILTHPVFLAPEGGVNPPILADHPRYRVVKLLGYGGMGAVYKAEHRVMHRPVAIKTISPRLTASAAAVERFRREVVAASRLSHPNIVTAHDAEQWGETW
jgi:Protein kinase domain